MSSVTILLYVHYVRSVNIVRAKNRIYPIKNNKKRVTNRIDLYLFTAGDRN